MATEVAAEAAATWDETQCIAALAQFEQLQAQVLASSLRREGKLIHID